MGSADCGEEDKKLKAIEEPAEITLKDVGGVEDAGPGECYSTDNFELQSSVEVKSRVSEGNVSESSELRCEEIKTPSAASSVEGKATPEPQDSSPSPSNTMSRTRRVKGLRNPRSSAPAPCTTLSKTGGGCVTSPQMQRHQRTSIDSVDSILTKSLPEFIRKCETPPLTVKKESRRYDPTTGHRCPAGSSIHRYSSSSMSDASEKRASSESFTPKSVKIASVKNEKQKISPEPKRSTRSPVRTPQKQQVASVGGEKDWPTPQQFAEAIASLRLELDQKCREKDALRDELTKLKEDGSKELEIVKTHYEDRLKEKARELQTAKGRLQELEAKEPKGQLLSDKETIVLSVDEVKELRKEVLEQEVLIKGYQAENEVATIKIKELEIQLKKNEELMLEEQQKLERQLLAVQEDKNKKNVETASKLKQILELQKELDGVREEATLRDKEMKDRIDGLRRVNKELEAKLGGINLSAMEAGDELVQQVRAEMENMAIEHQGMVKELQSKLEWYAENQDIVDRNDGIIQEQSDMINRLRMKMAEQEAAPVQSWVQRTRELEHEVAVLRDALSSRHPNSVPAIIQAAKPHPEETQRVQELKQQVSHLESMVRLKDEEYENSIRSLRQQYERLKVGKGNQPMQNHPRKKDGGRARELENQMEDMKASHLQQIQQLEVKVKDAEALRTGGLGAKANGTGATGSSASKSSLATMVTLKQRADRIRKLEAELESKDREIDTLKEQLADQPSEQVNGNESPSHSPHRSPSPPVPFEPAQCDSSHLGAEVGMLRRQIATMELTLQATEKAHAEAVEKCGTARAEHQKEIRQLSEDHSGRLAQARRDAAEQESAQWRQRVVQLEDVLESSRARIRELEQQVYIYQTRSAWAPESSDFVALENKIREMENQLASQETQWKRVFDDQWESHQMELDSVRRRAQAALEAKNAEIERFRVEVGAVLHSAQELRGSIDNNGRGSVEARDNGEGWLPPRGRCVPDRDIVGGFGG